MTPKHRSQNTEWKPKSFLNKKTELTEGSSSGSSAPLPFSAPPHGGFTFAYPSYLIIRQNHIFCQFTAHRKEQLLYPDHLIFPSPYLGGFLLSSYHQFWNP